MINMSVLKSEVNNFLSKAQSICDGDIELFNRVEYLVSNLADSYKYGEFVMDFEFNETLEAISEVSELNGVDDYHEFIKKQDYPELTKLIEFYKRKLSRKPKFIISK